MHATGPSNYEPRSSVKSRKSSVNRNLVWLDTESWALPEVPRMEHSQAAEHTLREACFGTSNNGLIDPEACGNGHYLSVLPPSTSLSSNMPLNPPDTLSILFTALDQLRSGVQKQKAEAPDHSTRSVVTQSFKNGETVEGVTEILLAEDPSFHESTELTKALRAIQKEMVSSA